MSAKKRKTDNKSEISPPAKTSPDSTSAPAPSSSQISPPEQLDENAPEQLDENAPEQSDSSALFEDFTAVPEPDEDTVIANYAIEMAMHFYVSRLLKPLFPLIRDIFRGKPASIEEIIDVMERTSVGERNLRDQIKIMLPKGADTLSLTRRE